MDVDPKFFSDETRRNPYPLYAQLRASSPLIRVPPPFDAWMILDYAGVKRALTDADAFSSRIPAPQWFIFFDPPQHTRLRALISRAFTPATVAALEPRIRALSKELLDRGSQGSVIDLAADYSVPMAMQVIAGMIGIPDAEWPRFRFWSDVILKLSYSRSGGEEAERSVQDFRTITAEMSEYLVGMIDERRCTPRPDLLTGLIEAEVEGQRLTHQEILGFIQLLIVAGQETTANLINNAMLCFMDHPAELQQLRDDPALLPGAIEEVLRYRSPLQWMMRTPRQDIEMHGQTIPAGKLVLCVIGSANRDPGRFPDPDRFDIRRDPNPHIAFGHGIHFCLGAALSRLESRIALTDLLDRFRDFKLVSSQPWVPRQGLNVHGPATLPLRFQVAGN